MKQKKHINLIHKYCILLLVLFNTCILNANIVPSDTIAVPEKPAVTRSINKNFKQKYTDSAYNYEVKEPSVFDKYKEWILRKIQQWLETSDKGAETIFNNIKLVIYILIIAGVVYYIIRIILDKKGRWIFKRKNNSEEIAYTNLEENITGANFQKLIQKANSDNDYRLAIRFYYLWLLKELDKNDHISYHPEKTNVDYQSEVATTKISEDFIKASYYYTYIWYGEFNINKEDYITASYIYNNLLKQITNE